MSDLTVSFLQTELHWQDAAANRATLDLALARLDGPTDLVVLPEMFTTGFSMEAATLAEPMDGPTVAWMRAHAARLDAVLTGSVIIEEGGAYYNRLLWVRPDGRLSYYNKRHLFTLAGEQHTYTPGRERLVEEWRGWRICPLVCYDLRFPVWSRNQPHEPYDLLLYVANWPAVRRTAWRTLLRARAIENVACALGVNRIGHDGLGHAYSGDSALIDAKGGYLVEAHDQTGTFTHTLKKAELDDFRAKFTALNDGDAFELIG
ncbi:MULTISPECIES: amidohydrolase [Hymenobacter]|uniref:Amidohydrolase n=1 Tax=Hymenobacter armeniacus TaxID=2771358 RepID=A0ABR8JXA9_9BACT|nr:MULTISPECIES: amidohydrolase [Hymenobacter]MBD2724596.1 amidohydrolase [Hymenobacter armeniacus]MBJ6110662.1 amidohydrolase [Hymenobacter sp. BT523]